MSFQGQEMSSQNSVMCSNIELKENTDKKKVKGKKEINYWAV